jgi:hypothetical protein
MDELCNVAGDEMRRGPAAALRQTITALQYAYLIVVLVFLLTAPTVRSIAAINSNDDIAKPTTTGPGGKPPPVTDSTRNLVKGTIHDDVTQTQKRVFEWVSLATAMTFIGNSVLVITHSLVMEKGALVGRETRRGTHSYNINARISF